MSTQFRTVGPTQLDIHKSWNLLSSVGTTGWKSIHQFRVGRPGPSAHGPGRAGVFEIWPWAGPGRKLAGPGRGAKPMGRAGPGRRIWGFVQLCTRYTVTGIFWDYRAHRFHIAKHPLCYPIAGNNLVGFQLNITHTFLETQSVRITTFYFILRAVY